MKLIRYLFFKLYSITISNGDKDPGWAWGAVTMFTMANLFTLINIVLLTIESSYPKIDKFYLIIFFGLFVYLNHRLLIGRKEKIIFEFQNIKSRKLNFYLALYVIMSIASVIYTGYLVRQLNVGTL